MRKFLSLLLGAVLLSSAAYGQDPYIYLEASQCLTDHYGSTGLLLPGLQLIPIEIRAYAPLGA